MGQADLNGTPRPCSSDPLLQSHRACADASGSSVSLACPASDSPIAIYPASSFVTFLPSFAKLWSISGIIRFIVRSWYGLGFVPG